MYKVEYRSEADEDLEKLDKSTRERVTKKVHWLAEYIENIKPEMLGGNYRGVYKLRIGNWRVIYGISHTQKTITVYTIGHRSEIYKA